MNTYEDADGKRQTSLSIVQRECSPVAVLDSRLTHILY
jgi:hypothetical protein